MKKLFVCEECAAEFTVQHNMEDFHYPVKYCAFCGETIELEDEIEDNGEEW